MSTLYKQEYKVVIKSSGAEVFFFAHTFRTAYQHMMRFVERNKGRFEMELYSLNRSSFGQKWKKMGEYK